MASNEAAQHEPNALDRALAILRGATDPPSQLAIAAEQELADMRAELQSLRLAANNAAVDTLGDEMTRAAAESIASDYTYRAKFKGSEPLGLCDEMPSLSWFADTPNEALTGIRELVVNCVSDMLANGETPPRPRGTDAT